MQRGSPSSYGRAVSRILICVLVQAVRNSKMSPVTDLLFYLLEEYIHHSVNSDESILQHYSTVL